MSLIPKRILYQEMSYPIAMMTMDGVTKEKNLVGCCVHDELATTEE
jgi:hypothetical protein